MSRMTVHTAVLMMWATAWLSASAEASEDHSSSKLTLHFAGNGIHTLEVRAITGNITVEAYDKPDVEMVVDKTIVADTDEDLARAKREVVLDMQDNASSVGAVARYPNQGVCGEGYSGSQNSQPRYEVRYDFSIRVPRNTRLQLCTINKGDVQIKGTQGDFDIRSVNGRIIMADIAGSGTAVTVNGPVTASFVRAPQSASTFKTINGEVAVTMPEGLAADLHMKTFNGSLFTDFAVQPQAVRTDVTTEKHGSMSVYRTSGFTTVRVGNGGPELTLETLNGDVRVMRRAR